MEKNPIMLSHTISTGNVTKCIFKKTGDIIEQGLHFIPGDKISSILQHQHTNNAEKYYKLVIKKTKSGQVTSMHWEPLSAVSPSTPENDTHSVESSDEIQIIFGVKRESTYTEKNWPKDILPKVSYSYKEDIFRFTLGDEKIYVYDHLRKILSKETASVYQSPILGDSKRTSDVDYKETSTGIDVDEFNKGFNEGARSPKRPSKHHKDIDIAR